MSGGVDSSATAALLLEQGYDVVGITLKLWPQDCVSRAEDKCCGPQAVSDARAVCHQLGVPYYLIDEAADGPVPEHAPVQPVNIQPWPGVAASVTCVPRSHTALQSVVQLMALGVDVTRPLPLIETNSVP